MERLCADEYNEWVQAAYACTTRETSVQDVYNLADNLNAMYEAYPQLWRWDDDEEEWVPNDQMEEWLFGEAEAWEEGMDTHAIYARYRAYSEWMTEMQRQADIEYASRRLI